MKKFTSILQLIGYVESIPEEKFIKNSVGKSSLAACVMGHINVYLHSFTQHTDLKIGEDGVTRSLSNRNMLEIGVDPTTLVDANNESDNPKEGVLTYLKSLVNGNN